MSRDIMVGVYWSSEGPAAVKDVFRKYTFVLYR
jgi:hypothetical protein